MGSLPRSTPFRRRLRVARTSSSSPKLPNASLSHVDVRASASKHVDDGTRSRHPIGHEATFDVPYVRIRHPDEMVTTFPTPTEKEALDVDNTTHEPCVAYVQLGLRSNMQNEKEDGGERKDARHMLETRCDGMGWAKLGQGSNWGCLSSERRVAADVKRHGRSRDYVCLYTSEIKGCELERKGSGCVPRCDARIADSCKSQAGGPLQVQE